MRETVDANLKLDKRCQKNGEHNTCEDLMLRRAHLMSHQADDMVLLSINDLPTILDRKMAKTIQAPLLA